MKVILDIEANGLEAPTEIWLIVCKDVLTGYNHIFRNVTSDDEEKLKFKEFVTQVDLWIGHNILGYDLPFLASLLDLDFQSLADKSCDTLIISKLVDYSRKGHSVADYGIEFGQEKKLFFDFSKYSIELEEYCLRDIDITYKIYLKYLRVIEDTKWSKAIDLEHKFQVIVNSLHSNGFSFNTKKAQGLLDKVSKELEVLDEAILKEFPPKSKLIREVHPKLTKHGTLSRTDFRFVKDGDLSNFNGGPFSRIEWVDFNPSSHKQIVKVLIESGWSPIDKTQTHIDTERELQRLKYSNQEDAELDIATKNAMMVKLEELKKTGWKVNENNLATLPSSAPAPARLLAKRILLEARRRTLTEWLSLVASDGRIHGRFYSIGAWTHRMAHQNPNTANIPSEFKEDGSPKLLGREMRQLWQAPRNRLLVGVDAEGIQLRIFAHYIEDPEFTDALVRGKKSDKTDPHSLNQKVIGRLCKTRQAAKRFIYALLLGAGMSKLSQILECSESEAREALDRLLDRYTGFARLRQTTIQADARRGYFIGLDGRRVLLPGDTPGERKHLCMSGYLQNGEAIVVKRWTLKALPRVLEVDETYRLVNLVHDEKIGECANDVERAIRIAKIEAETIAEVGVELGLKCPLAGSYWNDDHNDYTIGTNWYQTH